MGNRRKLAEHFHPIPGLTLMGENGITRREWAAVTVAAALVANGHHNPQRIAEEAVRVADAVAKELLRINPEADVEE